MISLKASARQRLLLFTAIEMYEKSAKACIGTLKNLNLATAQVETVQSRCGIAKDSLEKEKAGKAVEFTQPIAVTLRDCLALYFGSVEKLKSKAEDLQAGTTGTEELQQELKALHLALGDQTTLPLDHKPAEDQGDLLGTGVDGQGDLLGTGVDGQGTPPPKADAVKPLTGIPD